MPAASSLAALALLVLAPLARADYVLQQNFAAGGCLAGTEYVMSSTFGDIGGAPASGGGSSGGAGGCRPVAGTIYSIKAACLNASYAVEYSYTNPNCAGNPSQSSPVTFGSTAWGCTTQGASSVSLTCVAGAFSPAFAAVKRSYSTSVRCTNATVVAPTSVTAFPLNTCVPAPGALGAGSFIASCNGTAYTATQFFSAGCPAGAGISSTSQLGCADSSAGPSTWSCTGAVASPSATPTISASPSHTPAAGSSPSVTASATPSSSGKAIPAVVILTKLYDGVGCTGALQRSTYVPNACFTDNTGAASYEYSCVNKTFGTKIFFAGLACAGQVTRTTTIENVGVCHPANSGNAVQSAYVECDAGTFAPPANSVVVTIYSPRDTCTKLKTPVVYEVVPTGCIPSLGGAYSSSAGCNATAVFLNNYNGGTCSASSPNGTTTGTLLKTCTPPSGGKGPMTYSCTASAVTAAASHTPAASASSSVGSTASPSPSYQPTPSSTPNPVFLPPAGFKEDLSWTPVYGCGQDKTKCPNQQTLGTGMPYNGDFFGGTISALEIFIPKKDASGKVLVPDSLPSSTVLFMSVLVKARNPFSFTKIEQLVWPGLVVHTENASQGEYIMHYNMQCHSPFNPSGVCAVFVSNDDEVDGFQLWVKVYSNVGTAIPGPMNGGKSGIASGSAAAAPASFVGLAAGAAGGAVGIILVCLLLHWLRVLTVPCFNCLCDHQRAGVAKKQHRKSFGEVVTVNNSIQSYETTLPQRRSGA